MEIKYLFEPRTIAVIGASRDTSKVGYKILENIVSGGYKGKIFPLNPEAQEILGLKVYQDLTEIEGEIDLAIVSVPAKNVFNVIKDWPENKVKFLIIVASGFSEIGNIEEEKRVVETAKGKGMRVLGPNVFGIYSSLVFLNATFGAKVPAKPGHLAILSQSGALGIALMGRAEMEGTGLSSIVFEGNKADLNESEILPYFLKDGETKAVFIYLEGIKEGKELTEILKETTMKKPVVLLKAGLSEKGREAAVSHTGSLAGEAGIFSAVMKQCGVIQAETLEQAVNWSKFLAETEIPKGENTVIITNGGGMGILATDACEKYGVFLYEDRNDLKETFFEFVPAFGSLKNPVDITGQARAEDYKKALQKALQNKNIHSVICLGCETAVLDNKELGDVFEEMNKAYKKAQKPIVFAFSGGKEVQEELMSLKGKDVPIFGEIQEAVSTLGSLYRYFRSQNKKPAGSVTPLLKNEEIEKIQKITEKAKEEKRTLLYPQEAKEIAKTAGISFPESYIVSKMDEAVQSAEKIGFPVVLKIAGKNIAHKTEAGGVFLDLKNKEDVQKAYEQIGSGTAEIAKMIKGGTEIIVGAKKDRDFGTLVMVGLGGIYAEVFKDVVFRAFPVNEKEAREMISEMKSYPLLAGARGQKKKDILALADLILKLGAIVQNCPAISETEINPVAVLEKGIQALDIRILLKS